MWLARQNINLEDIVMEKEEVSEVKWVTKEELGKMIENNETSGSVSLYYNMFIDLLRNFR